MTIGTDSVRAIIRGLASDDPDEREEACGTIRDWKNSLSSMELNIFASALVNALLLEVVAPARDELLFTICELFDTGLLKVDSLLAINQMDAGSLSQSEREYYDFICEQISP